MTYMPELRSALVDAARHQQAAPEPSHRRRTPARASWRGSAHGARAVLASIVLGLTGTAVGAVQVGPPLGPEPPPSHVLARHLGAASSRSPRP
jgi:hypothetical protein